MILPDFVLFLINIFVIIVLWLLMGLTYNIWGKLLSTYMGFKFEGIDKTFSNIWLGWTFCITILSFYQIFFPINIYVSIFFYCIPILLFGYKHLKELIIFIKNQNKYIIIISLLFLITIASFSLQPPNNYDSGLYHFNSIRWNNEYHAIKGLGNLHTKLALNQLYLVYVSSLNFHPFLSDFSCHIANGFLFILLSLWLILKKRTIYLVLLSLLNYLPMPFFFISTPSCDFASSIVLVFLFCFSLEYFYYLKGENNYHLAFPFILLLSFLSITLKLSNGVFAVCLSAIALWFCRSKLKDEENKRAIKTSIAFVVLLMTIWVTRGYIQSGYPLFPTTIGKINFKWTIPEETTRMVEKEVYVYARLDNIDYDSPLLKDYKWLKPWANYNFLNNGNNMADTNSGTFYSYFMHIIYSLGLFNAGISFLFSVFVSLLLFCLYLVISIKKTELFKNNIILLLLFISCIVSLVFWFLKAPAIRFSNGLSIMLLCLSLIIIKSLFNFSLIKEHHKNNMVLFALLTYIWHFCIYYYVDIYHFKGFIPLRKANMVTQTTKSGLKVLVPTARYQSWNSELPSTPNFDENLSLIGDKIEDGFYIQKD